MSQLMEKAIPFRSLSAAEQQAKRDLVSLLEHDRVRLLARQPFVASLAMRMDLVPVVDFRLPTAATDGERLFFNPFFMRDLDEDERLFVMAHEVWHCAALHFPRQRGREAKRWNIAIDHEVNSILEEQGLKVIKGCILFKELRGLNAEEVYERLPAEEECLPDRGEHADVHNPACAPGEGDSSTGDDPMPMDRDFCPGGSDQIWKEWPRRVHAAAQQVWRNRGDQPGWLQRILDFHGQPKISWRVLLSRFVDKIRSDSYHWTPPNRRFIGQGLILPGRGGQRLSLAVALDVSGSTVDDLPGFLAELKGILRSYGRFDVHLLACDTELTLDARFSDDRPLPDSLPLGGGGGTDLIPVFDRLKADPPRALVFLTDGFATVPDKPPGYPVMWCLTEQGQPPSLWGEAIWM